MEDARELKAAVVRELKLWCLVNRQVGKVLRRAVWQALIQAERELKKRGSDGKD